MNDRDILRHARLYRHNPAKLHASLAASRVERSPKCNKDYGAAATGTTPAV
jgi:hypothetical protein